MDRTLNDNPSATCIQLPNSEQFHLANGKGQEYLIQLSWPLEWPNGHGFTGEAPIIYIVDGNALFLTATETAWRRATSSQYSGGGIIVAIGYPSLNEKLYDMQRRSSDLTPPQPTTSTTHIAGHGGANALLNFIESAVKPAVKARFPQVTVTREALFGHSYGGLFALHALFTRPELFDCYIASSPSIWWNDRFIEQEAATFFLKSNMNSPSQPSLMVFWGSLEQDAPPRNARESSDDYEAREKIWLDLRMVDNARELCDRLTDCERLQKVLVHEFEGEEHTSVMACSVNRGLTVFFEVWSL
ncbi:Putative esterase [Penicillium occitanis (nom. inval.)]|nr:hypothetical protein PENOC_063000 [Penicillium occitanis (nom. inval.)]PCG99168.1 Putative esterase [Penicillium occitanis (nom. inval.)]